MASSNDTVVLPAPAHDQTYVTISALEAGQLTLPERLFVTDADPERRATVPSLSFLIRHGASNLVFDLGLKRDFSGYREAQQHHIAQRQPTSVSPDAADSLRRGGLDPKDVDVVILSHVHWDHVGTPSDFTNARFVVGSGTMHLLANGGGPLYPSEIFNPDELPADRTSELPPVRKAEALRAFKNQLEELEWKPLAGFPASIDFYGDGSLFIIDAPGHLFGHINLLARTGPVKWVYLGGDCCHDPRILSGEKGIALYDDGKGGLRSVHADTDAAAATVQTIARLLKQGTVREEDGGPVEVKERRAELERRENKIKEREVELQKCRARLQEAETQVEVARSCLATMGQNNYAIHQYTAETNDTYADTDHDRLSSHPAPPPYSPPNDLDHERIPAASDAPIDGDTDRLHQRERDHGSSDSDNSSDERDYHERRRKLIAELLPLYREIGKSKNELRKRKREARAPQEMIGLLRRHISLMEQAMGPLKQLAFDVGEFDPLVDTAIEAVTGGPISLGW
ncbi:hypothetical protein J4E85_006556 [Alternaria conjuncta]|uniref:uncharacterized protein n=1 Tax=Alternaria conjuncta TaxID=181017 RepID=UPI00221F7550|nr:uncharacterized protein J4E85_006556 [Alternaria conjuncta]KAI4926264.1 hypothetical protein J4E85_006556 [Alternaria conjuncta]